MPHFKLETNLPKDKIPADFLKTTATVVAKTLGKPENLCVATVVPDTLMSWCGTSDPCAIASLSSIGKLSVEENKKHAKVLYEHVEKNLGIPGTRMYISFIDVKTSDVGYQGTTIHELFGGNWS